MKDSSRQLSYEGKDVFIGIDVQRAHLRGGEPSRRGNG
jgi:hypothetical protein